MVEFEKNSIMKSKMYSYDCVVRDKDNWLIIIITHSEYTFFINNNICRVWTRVKDTFLQPKSCRQSIITSAFLLPFG